MEFFETVKQTNLDVKNLQNLLTIGQLPKLCDSIQNVISDEKDKGVIYCVWGEQDVSRTILKHGVRFSLTQCPNALTWSVTIKERADSNDIVIHCCTDMKESDEDFTESIREFVRGFPVGIAAVM